MPEPVAHDKHDDSGRFAAEYQPEQFVEAIESADIPTTADIADSVGCAHRTALHHLNALEENGKITSRMVGRAKVWALANENDSE